MSSDLIAWLREQIAEDEEAARKRLHHSQQNHLLLQDPKYLGRIIPGWHEWPEIEAAAAHALAVGEAHTAIVEGYAALWANTDRHTNTALHLQYNVLEQVVRTLALAYRHRSGYREEWRP